MNMSDNFQPNRSSRRRMLLFPATKQMSNISLESSLMEDEEFGDEHQQQQQQQQQNPSTANSTIDTSISITSSLGDADAPSTQYHDFSFTPDVEIPCKTKGGVKVPFPVKLFLLLEHVDLYEPELSNIISWQPHGRCFMTHDNKRMEEQNVLSRFFRQHNYSSFRRQLNLWGFKRIKKGPDQGAYYHELFLRGKPYLCRAIVRSMSRMKAGGSFDSDEEQEQEQVVEPPEFHNMPVLPPSHPFVQVSFAEFSQDTNSELMTMSKAEAEYGHGHGHGHNAAPAATIQFESPLSNSHNLLPPNAPKEKTTLSSGSSIATSCHKQCDDDLLDQDEKTDITEWSNLTVYAIGNSPPATDSEMSDIMIFLKKLRKVEDESEHFCEGA